MIRLLFTEQAITEGSTVAVVENSIWRTNSLYVMMALYRSLIEKPRGFNQLHFPKSDVMWKERGVLTMGWNAYQKQSDAATKYQT